MQEQFAVSERRACTVVGQARATERYVPRESADEAALTTRIVALATRFGRYGYRRVTALLHREGWQVNHKRVERLWRREGLRVPAQQPKRGRLWLADGSVVRLRAEHPNHVWAYDFVLDRTADGRKLRMLTVVDEYSRECLAIEVARRLSSQDVLAVLAELCVRRGPPLHRAREPVGERLHRVVQRPAARRASEPRTLRHAARGAGVDRDVAQRIQPGPPTLGARVPISSARSPRGRTRNAETLTLQVV